MNGHSIDSALLAVASRDSIDMEIDISPSPSSSTSARHFRHSSCSTLIDPSSSSDSDSASPRPSSSMALPPLLPERTKPQHRFTPPSQCRHRATQKSFLDSELGRLILAFVYFTVICIGMAFCNQLSDHRWVETNYTNIMLSDRGFDVIPAQEDIGPANFFVMTSVVLTVAGIGLLCPDWTTRALVVRRVLWVIGSLSAVRSLTLSVTTLPTPKEGCTPSLKTGFWDMFIVALQMIPGTVEACTDDIFSGHTVFMVTCAIQWRLYCKNKWVTYFSYAYVSVGLYFVIATRLHYTVDVVLAIFLTYGFWSIYIAVVEMAMEQQYFGLEDPRDKYRLYDTVTSTLDEEKMVYRKQTSSLGEHDRVAFVPMQLNSSFTRIIRWCDGIDLRAHEITFTENKPSWDDCVVDYRSGALSQREFMTAYRHMNNGMDGGMDSVQVHVFDPMDAYAPHGAAACRCCEKPQYSPFRVIVDFFKSMRNVESEKSRTRGHNSKLRILKIVALVVVNTILVIKAVQIYQERVAGPPSHWPKDMETYPGGVIWHDSQTATPSLVPTI